MFHQAPRRGLTRRWSALSERPSLAPTSRLTALLVVGLLSGPPALAQAPSLQTAQQHIVANAKALDLTADDLGSLVLVDHHVSTPSGVAHYYFQQHADGIPLQGGIVNVGIGRSGEVISSTSPRPPGPLGTGPAEGREPEPGGRRRHRGPRRGARPPLRRSAFWIRSVPRQASSRRRSCSPQPASRPRRSPRA
jgi:hypothetical protein